MEILKQGEGNGKAERKDRASPVSTLAKILSLSLSLPLSRWPSSSARENEMG
jgi:hypothetical protein